MRRATLAAHAQCDDGSEWAGLNKLRSFVLAIGYFCFVPLSNDKIPALERESLTRGCEKVRTPFE
eukprot:3856108-Pleurochrysis_carterae.AAC.1